MNGAVATHPAPRPGAPGVLSRFARLSLATRVAVVGVAVLAVITLLVRFGEGATRSANPNGPRSSSLSTGANGAAAFRELLATYGVPTRTQRGPIADLDPSTTFIVIDGSDPDDDEISVLMRFMEDGGELVTAGEARWMEEIWPISLPARESNLETNAIPAKVGDEQFRVRTSDGFTYEDGNFVRSLNIGSGEARQVADGSAFSNQRLAAAENAAFVLSVVGLDRTVVFAEGLHGFGEKSGLDAIPGRWRLTLYGGSLAALLTMLAAGRRLGPPEARRRELPPARLVYVDAIGTMLRRSNKPEEALEPVRTHIQAEVDAGHVSLSPQETAAMSGSLDREGVLALGRALARREPPPAVAAPVHRNDRFTYMRGHR